MASTFTYTTLSQPTNGDNAPLIAALEALANSTLGTPITFTNYIVLLPRIALYSPPANSKLLKSLSPNIYFASPGAVALTVDIIQGRGLSTAVDVSQTAQVLIVCTDVGTSNIVASIEVVF